MKILIDSKPLCDIPDSSMGELHEMLIRHSLTFQWDESKRTLTINSPFQGVHVYLENGNTTNKTTPELSKASGALLEKTGAQLARLGFDVHLVEDEDTKKKMMNKQDDGGQGLWISILNRERTGNGISAYFSFQQMKPSKQLANLLIQSIAKHTDLTVDGVLFEWKNIMNYIFPLSAAQPIPMVVLACDELNAAADRRPIDQLSEAIPQAVATFCNQAAFPEVIRYCLAQKDIPEPHKQAAVESKAEDQAIRETVPPSPRHSPAPNHSTFSWMHQQAKKQVQPAQAGPKTISSFIGYMNKLSQVDNAHRAPAQQSVNMFTLERRPDDMKK